MRFMMLMIPKGYEKAAPGTMPDATSVAAMMKYNDSLQKAGVLLALDGLIPIVGLDQIEPCDDFFRLGERPIRDRHLAVPHANRLGGRHRLKRLGRVQFPPLAQRRAAGQAVAVVDRGHFLFLTIDKTQIFHRLAAF